MGVLGTISLLYNIVSQYIYTVGMVWGTGNHIMYVPSVAGAVGWLSS